ncbi:MAG: hypothetical protein WB611_26505, partial [Stellaceae bacterium]
PDQQAFSPFPKQRRFSLFILIPFLVRVKFVRRAFAWRIRSGPVADTMACAETHLGVARRGQGGGDGAEAGNSGGSAFSTTPARPAVDIERRNREGQAYADIREVPLQTADPQLHTHGTGSTVC